MFFPSIALRRYDRQYERITEDESRNRTVKPFSYYSSRTATELSAGRSNRHVFLDESVRYDFDGSRRVVGGVGRESHDVRPIEKKNDVKTRVLCVIVK